MQKSFVWVFLLRHRATWKEVGLYLCQKRRCGSITLKNIAAALMAVLLDCWLCLPCCCAGSAFDYLGEDEKCVVVFFVVVVCAAFVVVVDFGRVRCSLERCWFGCRCRGNGGRRSYSPFQSAAHNLALRGVPKSCRGSEIVVVFVDSGWLLVCDGVSPSHLLACFRCPLCLVDIAGFNVE